MPHYKAKLSGIEKFNIKPYQKKRCVLPISVGNPNQEKAKLAATLDLISKRFLMCDLILADTLQRHNLSGHFSSEKANFMKKQQGDTWIETNKYFLENFPIPLNLIRWDQCLMHPKFEHESDKLKKLYSEDPYYHAAIQRDILTFLKRQHASNAKKNDCLDYLLEETAVLLSFFFEKNYDFVLYPGKIPQSVDFILRQFIQPKNPNLLQPLRIYFKKQVGV